MAHSRTWNVAYEAVPSDGSDAKEGALRIRNLKSDISERMMLDHKWDPAASDDDNDGFHNKVTLLVQGSTPAAKLSASQIYSKDVSSKSEVHIQDEDANELVLTDAGVWKWLSDNNTFTVGQTVTSFALTDSGTVTPDCNNANIQTWTMEGSRILANPNTAVDGFCLSIIIKQDATGGRGITYGAKWLFPAGINDQPSDGANEYSMITGVYSSLYDSWFANIIRNFV